MPDQLDLFATPTRPDPVDRLAAVYPQLPRDVIRRWLDALTDSPRHYYNVGASTPVETAHALGVIARSQCGEIGQGRYIVGLDFALPAGYADAMGIVRAD